MPRPYQPWTDKDIDFLTLECRRGVMTVRQIAKRMGRSHMSVYKFMGEHGIRRVTPKRVWTPERCELLAALWGEELTIHEIAARIGLTVGAVERQAAEEGMPRRSTMKQPHSDVDMMPRQIKPWPDLPPDAFKDYSIPSTVRMRVAA